MPVAAPPAQHQIDIENNHETVGATMELSLKYQDVTRIIALVSHQLRNDIVAAMGVPAAAVSGLDVSRGGDGRVVVRFNVFQVRTHKS